MIVEQTALERSLRIVQEAAARRTTVPALSAIELEGQKDALKLSATDLEIMIETRLTAKDGSDFKELLPREQFVELVRGLPTGEVHLTPDGHKIQICWSGGAVTMTTVPAEELRGLPIPDKGLMATIDSSVLHRLLRQTSVAAAPNPGMPQLEGCAFEFNGSRLRLFGTDGFRLAVAATTEDEKVVSNVDSRKFILPLKAVNQLLRLLPEKRPVQVTFGDSTAVFEFDGTRIVSRLIGGQYPDVSKVIPKSYAARVTVEAQALAGAVKRVALFSEGDLKPVTVAVSGGIVIFARSEFGQAKEEIPATVEGQVGEIIFTSAFLLQGLTAMESEKVNIEFTGPITPAQIKPADKKGDTVYVLLPIRPKAGEQVQGGKEAAGG